MRTFTELSEIGPGAAERLVRKDRGEADSWGPRQWFWTVNNFAGSWERAGREIGTKLLSPIVREMRAPGVQRFSSTAAYPTIRGPALRPCSTLAARGLRDTLLPRSPRTL